MFQITSVLVRLSSSHESTSALDSTLTSSSLDNYPDGGGPNGKPYIEKHCTPNQGKCTDSL